MAPGPVLDGTATITSRHWWSTLIDAPGEDIAALWPHGGRVAAAAGYLHATASCPDAGDATLLPVASIEVGRWRSCGTCTSRERRSCRVDGHDTSTSLGDLAATLSALRRDLAASTALPPAGPDDLSGPNRGRIVASTRLGIELERVAGLWRTYDHASRAVEELQRNTTITASHAHDLRAHTRDLVSGSWPLTATLQDPEANACTPRARDASVEDVAARRLVILERFGISDAHASHEPADTPAGHGPGSHTPAAADPCERKLVAHHPALYASALTLDERTVPGGAHVLTAPSLRLVHRIVRAVPHDLHDPRWRVLGTPTPDELDAFATLDPAALTRLRFAVELADCDQLSTSTTEGGGPSRRRTSTRTRRHAPEPPRREPRPASPAPLEVARRLV